MCGYVQNSIYLSVIGVFGDTDQAGSGDYGIMDYLLKSLV